MLERFSDPARQVVAEATEGAVVRGDDHLGTEHLLLSLLKHGDGPGVRVLDDLGVDRDVVRRDITEAPEEDPSATPNEPQRI